MLHLFSTWCCVYSKIAEYIKQSSGTYEKVLNGYCKKINIPIENSNRNMINDNWLQV